jgi:hypothetical protein
LFRFRVHGAVVAVVGRRVVVVGTSVVVLGASVVVLGTSVVVLEVVVGVVVDVVVVEPDGTFSRIANQSESNPIVEANVDPLTVRVPSVPLISTSSERPPRDPSPFLFVTDMSSRTPRLR